MITETGQDRPGQEEKDPTAGKGVFLISILLGEDEIVSPAIDSVGDLMVHRLSCFA